MKKIFSVAFLVFILTVANCQMNFTSFLDSINKITDPATKLVLIDTLFKQLGTKIPYIEGEKANFIYTGTAESVWIAGDFNGWGDVMWKCKRIEDTDFFYYSTRFNLTARVDYKFIVNETDWILDPRNPNQVSGGFGPNSELAMSDYVQPWEIEDYEGVEQGSIESFTIESPELGKTYNISVYLPPGYSEEIDKRYSTAYVHDGGEYISLGSMANVLDNLLDENTIDPIIAVFISPKNRNDEYAGDKRYDYAKYIVDRVIPHIDANYRTWPYGRHRLTMGASFGGNISGLISYTYPNIFANSAWHSPALFPNNMEVHNMYVNGKKDVKIYFNFGAYEGIDVYINQLMNGLNANGYEYDWKRFYEGHSWGLWRATIDDVLIYFFPPGSTSAFGSELHYSGEFRRGKNFPNPTQYRTYIPLTTSQKGTYTMSVYNQLGQLELSRDYTFTSEGKQTIEMSVEQFSEGIYSYIIRLDSKNISGTLVKH